MGTKESVFIRIAFKKTLLIIAVVHNLGTVHFLWVMGRGGALVGFRGGMRKKIGYRGGPSQKCNGKSGGRGAGWGVRRRF